MDDLSLRLALSLVVIAGCALAGRSVARVDMRRARLIAETMDSLQLLRIHMLDGLMPLRAAMEKTPGTVFVGMRDMPGGGSAREAWAGLKRKEARRGGALDCMGADEREILDRLFESLGETGEEEQRRRFDSAIKELGALEDTLRGEGERRNRLYTTLGALAGAAVAVGLL